MANPDHVNIFHSGTQIWNQWRLDNQSVMPDLSDENLSARRLVAMKTPENSGVTLSGSRRREANLTRMDHYWTAIIKSDRTNIDLSSTSLRNSDLSGLQLSRANLSRADLIGANMSGSILYETILSDAIMQDTTLVGIDLSTAVGLETVRHLGPSGIGLDTIFHSKGRIPEAFLRGVGAPNIFIDNIKLLTANRVPYYSCFISYSTKDQQFIERLHADLRANGVRCWYAPEDLRTGDPIRHRIYEAVGRHDKLLVVLSKSSIDSVWVGSEVETALENERAQKNRFVIFPISLDDTIMNTGTAWAAEIRRKTQSAYH